MRFLARPLLSLALLTPLFGVSQIYDDYLGVGHDNGVTITSSSESIGTSNDNTLNGFGMDQHLADASRFLGQATLGYNYEMIDQVSQQGIENWIDIQYATPEMSYLDTTWMVWDSFIEKYIEVWGEDQILGNDDILAFQQYWRAAWWQNTMTGDDHLRQRVALALSEILIISDQSDLETSAFSIADYYDVLYKNAFGNYRDILDDVTHHASMGYYLSHLNNEKTDEVNNIHPDENYAREIMQLFSIGLYELNNDGTIIVDVDDVPVPTYDNDDIKEFAKVFTGFGPYSYFSPWEDLSGIPVLWDEPFNTVPFINAWEPMVMYENWHEPGEKYLLNGQVVPAGQSGEEDIQDAIDNVFNHENVGPFIGTKLIKLMVKSNPTPEYVNRVANAFNDNGEGIRGDMKAVIKAILLDDEARDCSWLDMEASGKLREPMLRYMQMLKAFDASNQSGRYYSSGFFLQEATTQHPVSAPSVFNFFLPEYTPPGPIMDAELVAPEFEILNSATTVSYVNMIYQMLISDYYMDVTTEASTVFIGAPDFEGSPFVAENWVNLDFGDEEALADNVPELVDRLDILLTGGIMTDETKQSIIDTTELFFFDDTLAVKVAIMMVMISPDYVIQK